MITHPRAIYALAAVAVFIIEVCIALFVHDAVVRPYLGDALAVVLLYLALRATTRLKLMGAAAVAFAVAFALEWAQGLHMLEHLGLSRSRLARVVLGGSFDPQDFLAYAAGALGVVAAELSLSGGLRLASSQRS